MHKCRPAPGDRTLPHLRSLLPQWRGAAALLVTLALSSRETGDGVYPTPVVKVLRPLGSGSSRDHHEPAVNGS